MTIEISEYGFMLDMGNALYFSLSWATIITATILLTAYKVYTWKRYRYDY